MAVSILFMAVLALPGLAMLAGVRPAPAENRLPATFPPISVGGVLDPPFFASVDKVISDAFPLRESAIRAYATLDYGLLHGSTTPQVTVGTDDWLFFTEDAMPTCRWTPDEVAATVAGIGRRLQATGRDLRFAIVPGKDAIYPDKLPPDLPPSCTDAYRGGLLAAMAASEGRMIDFWTPTLAGRAADQAAAAYFEQDSHWTPTGALPAIETLIRSMKQDAWDPSKIRIEGDDANLGDLSVLIGLPKIERVPAVVVDRGSKVAHDTIAPQIPFDGNRSVDVFTSSAQGSVPGTTLFVYDSTFGRMMALVAPWYERSVWIHNDDLTLHPEIVRQLPNIEHVVVTRVERGAYLTDFEFVLRPILTGLPTR